MATRRLLVRAFVCRFGLSCAVLFPPPASDQIHQQCLSYPSGFLLVHVSLAGLEFQQMDPVAELDIFWLGHFSCLPEGLCFANFFSGCRLPLLCMAIFGHGHRGLKQEGFLGAAADDV